jgi:hypothetical protein
LDFLGLVVTDEVEERVLNILSDSIDVGASDDDGVDSVTDTAGAELELYDTLFPVCFPLSEPESRLPSLFGVDARDTV